MTTMQRLADTALERLDELGVLGELVHERPARHEPAQPDAVEQHLGPHELVAEVVGLDVGVHLVARPVDADDAAGSSRRRFEDHRVPLLDETVGHRLLVGRDRVSPELKGLALPTALGLSPRHSYPVIRHARPPLVTLLAPRSSPYEPRSPRPMAIRVAVTHPDAVRWRDAGESR